MTVSAELNFASNIASEAAAAAASVNRLHGALSALDQIGGISFGGGISDDIKDATSATNELHAALVAVASVSAQAVANMQAMAAAARSGATGAGAPVSPLPPVQSGPQRDAQGRFLPKGSQGVPGAAPGLPGPGSSPEALQAHLMATEQAHVHRIIEMQQAGRNEIFVGNSKAMHAESAARLANEHKIAALKIKGEQDANKIALKGDEDRKKLAFKAQLDAQKQAERDARRAATKGPSKLGDAASSLMQGGGLQGAASSLGGAAGTFASAAAMLAGAVGGAVIDGAKMAIDAAEFKNNMLQGLGKMLGGADAAQSAYKQIQTIANVTPFETQDVAIFYRTLAGGLGDVKKTEDALKAVADVAALNDFDTEKAKRLSDAIAKMAGSGKLSIETLNQLGDASGGVIGRGDIFDAVAAMTGQARSGIQKQIEQGKIDSSKGLDAILSVVKKKVSGGELGSLAKTLGESSVTGLLSTIKGVSSSLLEDVDIQPIIKGLKTVSDAIQGPAGERLKGSLERFFSNIFEAVFGPLGDAQGPERVTKIIDQISTTIDKAAAAIKDATPTIQALGAAMLAFGGGDSSALDSKSKAIYGAFSLVKEAVKLILPASLGGTTGPGGMIQPILDILGIDADASGVRKWVDAVAGLMNPANIFRSLKAGITGGDVTLGNPILQYLQGAVDGAATAAFDGASSIGTNIVDGIVAGITGGIEAVKTAAVNLASSALTAAKDTLGIASPSGEFRDQVGLQSAAGIAVGMERGIPRVIEAASAMSDASLVAAMGDPFPYKAAPANGNAAASTTAAFAGGGSAAGGVVVNLNIVNNITANTAEDADAIARAVDARLRETLPAELTAVLLKASGQ